MQKRLQDHAGTILIKYFVSFLYFMKPQIRILGIDDASHNRNKDKEVIVIGTVFRGGDFLDGVLTTKVKVDGNDATKKIAEMINNSKFKVQLRAIMIDGIAVAGFNVIGIQELSRKTKLPVIVVMRGYPDLKKIKNALIYLKMKNKIKLIEKAGRIYPFNKIHFQYYGIKKTGAEQILKISIKHADIPEPIRVAHLIGQGLVFGESKGRA
jgi:endonuclease V-like protein UPF0215 family